MRQQNFKMECQTTLLLLLISMLCLFCVEASIRSSSENVFIVKEQQEDSCPLWFYFDTDTQLCQCFKYYGARCFDNKAYLIAGFCATIDEETEIVSLSTCPYHGFVYEEHDVDWYIQLPDNISTLNDYMCGPLNRKGRICSECIDGFGHSLTSFGFQYFECSNCSNAWYGIPLYLLVEFVPVTIFYFAVLILQVNITSAPMTCFIMYSQIIVLAYDNIFGGNEPEVRDVLLLVSKHSELWFSLMMTAYDVWNLRFFHYLLPSFCISESVKQIHLTFLGCISVFYPLFLIALTWLCVELHDRGFRPLTYLWQRFHRCFFRIRRQVDIASDLVNVFASFFLLSFTKVLYQTVDLLVSRKLKTVQYDDGSFSSFKYTLVVGADQSVAYGSTEHLVFLIPSALFCFVFVILPSLLLVLYPFRIFRACLSKCRLNWISLNFFVEKFYGCYRDGLDGGRDMRSFAGLYFIVRVMLLCSSSVIDVIGVANNDPYFWRNVVFTMTAVVIAICRPYKKTYINVLDILLVAYLGLLCHLMSAESSFSVRENVAYTFDVVLAFPFFCFILFFVVKAVIKVLKRESHYGIICNTLVLKIKTLTSRGLVFRSTSPSADQVLIDPSTMEVSYGTQ